MKHYVLMHRKPNTDPVVEGVFHEPTEPIAQARALAACLCSPERYDEEMSCGGDVFRATYGAAGECLMVVEAPPRPRAAANLPERPGRPPEELRRWLLGLLETQLDGEWEMVDALVERDVITKPVPGSPFLGKFPGANLFYSLHLRLNETARALLNVTDEDRAKVTAALEDDGE
ncbi:MAG: hypothetical protein GY838_13190 [bacterium]|nr:hypothetical protein [bacterium]